jgi:hypothetical protein
MVRYSPRACPAFKAFAISSGSRFRISILGCKEICLLMVLLMLVGIIPVPIRVFGDTLAARLSRQQDVDRLR